MGKDDYSSAVVGGGLKLKGVKSGGIEKKRKKKHSSKSKEKVEGAAVKDHVEGNSKHNEDGEETNEEKKLPRNFESQSEEQSYVPRRTEAEQRFEEMRRKRLDERLQREGAKSHKERVEEFNKHLASLSEHHDMPRIGPG